MKGKGCGRRYPADGTVTCTEHEVDESGVLRHVHFNGSRQIKWRQGPDTPESREFWRRVRERKRRGGDAPNMRNDKP